MAGEVVTVRCPKVGEVQVVIRPPVEHLQEFWTRGKFYEPTMLGHIRKYHRGGTFIDVGACIGNHTLYFAKFCRAALVVAVEPVATNRAHLCENVALNDFGETRVQVLGVALSDGAARGRMVEFWGKKTRNLGMYRLLRGEGETVVTTLDALAVAGEWENITVLKVDTEGSDLAILRGGAGLLKRWRPAVYAELGRQGLAEGQAYLARFGYEHVTTWGATYGFEVRGG